MGATRREILAGLTAGGVASRAAAQEATMIVPFQIDLALFIDREDDGMGGRIDIETDDVAQLVDEARVGGE
jgi:hypothetical protein